jgi:hypothetical protein
MSDEEFIKRFEDCTLPAEDFHHAHHIKVAWIYLHRYSVLETLDRFCSGLQRFATANGKTRLYHETISWAYVLLIHERVQRDGAAQSWLEFAEANADLFDWKNSLLKTLYQDETLRSDFARRVFVFPDK